MHSTLLYYLSSCFISANAANFTADGELVTYAVSFHYCLKRIEFPLCREIGCFWLLCFLFVCFASAKAFDIALLPLWFLCKCPSVMACKCCTKGGHSQKNARSMTGRCQCLQGVVYVVGYVLCLVCDLCSGILYLACCLCAEALHLACRL